MANKHMETSLVIREMQLKTTMKHHNIPIVMTKIKKIKTILNVDRDVENWNFHTLLGGV